MHKKLNDANKLKQQLSLSSLIIFGIGIIIGAGIYAILGKAASLSGYSLWLSFLIAGAIAFLTALSYCELITLLPHAGAEYIYLKYAYPDFRLPSFLMGFILLIAGGCTISTIALSFGGYLHSICPIPKTIGAQGLLLLATGINSLGIKNSSKANVLFTLIEVTGLFIIIWFGFNRSTQSNFLLETSINQGTFSAASLIFFVYLGFEDIANLVEETIEPSKTIPKAMLISLLFSTLLYMAVALAITKLVTPKVLASSDIPLAIALKNIAPKWMQVLKSIALFSTFNTCLISMLALSRMIYGIAKEGDLPKILTVTSKIYKTPYLAQFCTLVISVLFLLFGRLEILAGLSSFFALIGFFVVHWTLIILRFKMPKAKRPFELSLAIKKIPLVPIIGIISIAFLLVECIGPRLRLPVFNT